MMHDDLALVREFAATHSETAFAAVVERHAGLVYSTALRQTSDPHLAEDVVQTVFILLARKAAQLGPKTILSAWLYRATIYAAADALRTQRRRQAREQEAYMQSTQEPPDTWAQVAPVLDSAMAELSETDRAALVLRFFENRSAREIAAALELQEATAQKRVLRALDKLRSIFARRGVVVSATAIASVLTANAVQAAPAGLAASTASTIIATAASGTLGMAGVGLGAKILSLLGKAFTFAWLMPLLSVLGALPGMLVVSLIGKSERNNFRDRSGFRVMLHKKHYWSLLWGFPVVLLAIAFFNRSIAALWGINVQQLCMLGFLWLLTAMASRLLVICQSRFHIANWGYCVVMAACLTLNILKWLPAEEFMLIPAISTIYIMFMVFFTQQPTKMDYSLFLRAAHGLVPPPMPEHATIATQNYAATDLLAFARFLGKRYLVNNFAWPCEGLKLQLAPVRGRFLSSMLAGLIPAIFAKHSHIVLHYTGQITAYCGPKDLRDLEQLPSSRVVDPHELETSAANALLNSWHEFRQGNLDTAARLLGERPDSEIYLVAPKAARATLWRRVFVLLIALFLVGLMALRHYNPPWMNGIKTVQLTETEARKFINDTTPRAKPASWKLSDASRALLSWNIVVLPTTNLFSPERLSRMRDELCGNEEFDKWRKRPGFESGVFSSPLLRRAFIHGWLNCEVLGLELTDLSSALRRSVAHTKAAPQDPYGWIFGTVGAWSTIKQEPYRVKCLLLDGLLSLQYYQAMGCLDLLDRDYLIPQITQVQVLSKDPPPGRPALYDWKEVRGLFFTPNSPAIQDTYHSVAALDILGGLGQMDREACIQGVLRHHRGGGYFTSPNPGGYNEYHIDGSAHDTISAYETLRILGALDRVKDLPKWQFRVRHSKSDKGQVTWDDIEAWVCQERFRDILQAHQANPQQPWGSLLTPGRY